MKRREFGQGLASGLIVAGLLPGMRIAAAATLPTVTGPITGGRHGWAFSAYLGDMGALGYVEEEFFLEGFGTRYAPEGELKPDGKWEISPTDAVPFKTRFLVRRPRDPAHFNGVVLVEWLNVTVGWDLGIVGVLTEGIYRDGFAYVGISCQRAGLEGYSQNPHGLKVWDPERYGSLSIPGDSISYDILSQIGRIVGPDRPRDGVDPLRGLEVSRVVASGGSQSAGRLRTYINAVHPRDRVFDGFAPTIDFGLSFGFSDFVLDPSTGTMPSPAETFIRTRIRDDLDVPVFITNSETETLLFHPSRQPNTDRFRFWEVAGASHGPAQMAQYMNGLRKRDGLGDEDPANSRSAVMWQPTCDAALSHLAAWMSQGVQPPEAALIEVSAGEAMEVVRDPFGNALGGVRLPEVEVPVAHYQTAIRSLTGTEGLGGTQEPLAPDVLKRLYPTREIYVSRVTEAARAAEKAGVIEPARVGEYIEKARSTELYDP